VSASTVPAVHLRSEQLCCQVGLLSASRSRACGFLGCTPQARCTFGANGSPRSRASARCPTASRARVSLPGKGGMRCRMLALALKSRLNCPRSPRRRLPAWRLLPVSITSCRLGPRLLASLSLLWRPQLHARPPGLREPDCDGLFRGASPVLAFPDVLHFLPHEFSGLSGRSFAFPRVFSSSLERLLFRHKTSC